MPLCKPIAEALTAWRPLTRTEADALAEKYQVCRRTVYRWHAAGVDVQNTLSVAERISNSHCPKPATVRALLHLLEINK
jgi:hypothetical protein